MLNNKTIKQYIVNAFSEWQNHQHDCDKPIMFTCERNYKYSDTYVDGSEYCDHSHTAGLNTPSDYKLNYLVSYCGCGWELKYLMPV